MGKIGGTKYLIEAKDFSQAYFTSDNKVHFFTYSDVSNFLGIPFINYFFKILYIKNCLKLYVFNFTFFIHNFCIFLYRFKMEFHNF